jgi:error-prone DNA polymerase
VFEQVRGFSGFGFPKAHAAAFGLLAYQSTWLRIHYGQELLCALLNEQPMGFYPPDSLIHEAQRREFAVRAADVNRSEVECVVEGDLAVRVGLGYVKGVRAEEMEGLVAERGRGGPYEDLGDLSARSGVSREGLERLAWAGTMESLGIDAKEIAGGSRKSSEGRRADLWRVGVARGGRPARGQLSLPLEVPAAPPLRELSEWERVVADYAATGVTLGAHPMELMRPGLSEGVLRSEDLEATPDGARVEIAGMVVARQRPATARGVVFMLLEDEAGVINLVILPPAYERHRLAVRTASFLRVDGKLERREGVINVVADALESLATPDLETAKVRHIEPPAERETGRRSDRDAAVELEAVAPRAHSFGRR